MNPNIIMWSIINKPLRICVQEELKGAAMLQQWEFNKYIDTISQHVNKSHESAGLSVCIHCFSSFCTL